MNEKTQVEVTTETGEQVKFEMGQTEMETAATTEVEGIEVMFEEEELVERKAAIMAGVAGAIGSGIVGFVTGKYLEKNKRKKLLEAIQKGINEISKPIVEAAVLTEGTLEELNDIDISIEAMKLQINEVLKDTNITEKEKVTWVNMLIQVTSVASTLTSINLEKQTLDAKKQAE